MNLKSLVLSHSPLKEEERKIVYILDNRLIFCRSPPKNKVSFVVPSFL